MSAYHVIRKQNNTWQEHKCSFGKLKGPRKQHKTLLQMEDILSLSPNNDHASFNAYFSQISYILRKTEERVATQQQLSCTFTKYVYLAWLADADQIKLIIEIIAQGCSWGS